MGRSSARPLYLAEEPPGDEPHLHIASDGRGRVIIWRWRAKDRMELDRAWRLVLEDPNYEHRRRYYEHLVHSEQRRAEENARIKKEEGP